MVLGSMTSLVTPWTITLHPVRAVSSMQSISNVASAERSNA
jgi:hypothetical protein